VVGNSEELAWRGLGRGPGCRSAIAADIASEQDVGITVVDAQNDGVVVQGAGEVDRIEDGGGDAAALRVNLPAAGEDGGDALGGWNPAQDGTKAANVVFVGVGEDDGGEVGDGVGLEVGGGAVLGPAAVDEDVEIVGRVEEDRVCLADVDIAGGEGWGLCTRV